MEARDTRAQYEYLILKMSQQVGVYIMGGRAPDTATPNDTVTLDQLGAQGWELLAPNGMYAYFKREVLPPPSRALAYEYKEYPNMADPELLGYIEKGSEGGLAKAFEHDKLVAGGEAIARGIAEGIKQPSNEVVAAVAAALAAGKPKKRKQNKGAGAGE